MPSSVYNIYLIILYLLFYIFVSVFGDDFEIWEPILKAHLKQKKIVKDKMKIYLPH